MNAEQQYIDLYEQARDVIFAHSIGEMNTVRDQAFEDFRRLGFPSRKVERYKYTDMQKLFEPDYGLNLNRLQIPVDPYKAFRCDVPNLSTSLYFMVNDMFYRGYGGTEALPKHKLPEGVIIDSMCNHPEVVAQYYARLAKTAEDGVTALNTLLRSEEHTSELQSR